MQRREVRPTAHPQCQIAARDSYADHDVVANSDSVIFTNKRLIAINVQGLTGKKRDYSSLPYSKIQAWSIETAGRFDLHDELELWFLGLGKVRLDRIGDRLAELVALLEESTLTRPRPNLVAPLRAGWLLAVQHRTATTPGGRTRRSGCAL